MRSLLIVTAVFALLAPVSAQDAKSIEALDARIQDLEAKLKKLDTREQSWTEGLLRSNAERRADSDHIKLWTVVGFLLFAAIFCALWAQNTGRNAVLWFAAGFFTHVIALAVLLYKNSKDVAAKAKV